MWLFILLIIHYLHISPLSLSFHLNACVVTSLTRPLSRNSKLELELAQVRADFERLKSQDSTKSERLEELSYVLRKHIQLYEGTKSDWNKTWNLLWDEYCFQ